jgi:hypothetical protein
MVDYVESGIGSYILLLLTVKVKHVLQMLTNQLGVLLLWDRRHWLLKLVGKLGLYSGSFFYP